MSQREDLIDIIRGSLCSPRDAADAILGQYTLEPKTERLLCVGGPKHGEQLTVERGSNVVRVPVRTPPPYRQYGELAYTEVAYVRASVRVHDVLVPHGDR